MGVAQEARSVLKKGLQLMAIDLMERPDRDAVLFGRKVIVGKDRLRVWLSFRREGKQAAVSGELNGRELFSAWLYMEGGRLRGGSAWSAGSAFADTGCLAPVLRALLSEKGLRRLEERRMI